MLDSMGFYWNMAIVLRIGIAHNRVDQDYFHGDADVGVFAKVLLVKE